VKRRFKWLNAWPWWRWVLTGLSALAALLSIFLSWHYLSGENMAGCGGGSPCDLVMSSKWSMLAGMLPVSSLAVGVYLALFVASLFVGPQTEEPVRRLAWMSMLVMVGAVAGSALWFIIVQKWLVGAFCPYCMSTHLTGLLLTALVIIRVRKDRIRPLHTLGLISAGLLLSGMLVAFQVGFAPTTVYKAGVSQVQLPVLDYQNAPIIGSEDAPYKVTLLFDYNCAHCQKLHFMLPEVVRRYGGKLAFVLCPTPLNTKCNPYIPKDVALFKNSCEMAEIGLAVWCVNRAVYPEFDNWMFTYESGDRWCPRTLKAAKEKAMELVGKAKLEAALSNPWIGQYLQTSIRIFGQTLQGQKGGIPKLVYGSRWVIPEADNAENLMAIIRTSLAVPQP
jgi:uncharacterized membrane protein